MPAGAKQNSRDTILVSGLHVMGRACRASDADRAGVFSLVEEVRGTRRTTRGLYLACTMVDSEGADLMAPLTKALQYRKRGGD